MSLACAPDPSPPARVVVLGARGFIGSSLTGALGPLGWSCLPLGSAEIDLAVAGAEVRLAGLLRPDDALVFLAAITPDKGKDSAAFARNLAMGRAVGEALARRPVAHVVYFGSDAVYPFGRGLVSEASDAAPQDLYGAMHLARELMIRAAVAKTALAVVRPTLVYGLADTHNSYSPNRFRREAAERGTITIFGEGEETRDFIFIDDLVRLVILVLRHRAAGLVNAASGRSVSYRETARLVARQFSNPVRIVSAPRSVPVTHRAFDITALVRAFPSLRLTPLDEGVAVVHRQMMEGA